MKTLGLAVVAATLALLSVTPGYARLFSPESCLPSNDSPKVVIDNSLLPMGQWTVYGCRFEASDLVRITARLNTGLEAREGDWIRLDPVAARVEPNVHFAFHARIGYDGDPRKLRGGYLLEVTATDGSAATATELWVVNEEGELTYDPRLGTATKTFQLTLRGHVPEGELFVAAMDAEDVDHESLIVFCGRDPAVNHLDSGKICETGKTYAATRTFPKGADVNFAYSGPNDETFFGCSETMTKDSTTTATYTYGSNGGRGKGVCGGERVVKQPNEEREVSEIDGGGTKGAATISSTNPAPGVEMPETPEPAEVSDAASAPAEASRRKSARERTANSIAARPTTDRNLVLGSLAGAASLLVAVGYIALRRR